MNRYNVDAMPKKTKLAERSIKDRYLRAETEHQYLVLLPLSGTTRLIRRAEFLIKARFKNLIAQQNASEFNEAKTGNHQTIQTLYKEKKVR